MTPSRNNKSKLTMHSSCFVGNPEAKLESRGFYTFHSLQNKKNADSHANERGNLFGRTCKRELDMIESMTKRAWLNDCPRQKVDQRNMNDLVQLIQRQKQIIEAKDRLANKPKRLAINETCLKMYENVKDSEAKQEKDNACLNNLSKRSRSFDSPNQPTKVTIFKKLLHFNKNEHFSLTLQEKSRSLNTQMPKFARKVSLLSPLEAPVPKSIELPQMCLQRQQSIQCKGEILGKQDEIKKRKNRLRHLSLIEKEIVSRSHQPIFLQQI